MEYLKSATLLLVLLNPFLIILYLIDVIAKLSMPDFLRVVARAGVIAMIVFCSFAILGDRLFSDIVQANFASFQIFGGIVFLLIGLEFVFKGPRAITMLRGESAHLSGAIAMPILIGPATLSASVIVGNRHMPVIACIIIVAAVVVSLTIIVLLKNLHDHVKKQNEDLIERYIEVAGRVMALIVGSIAVEMVMQGITTWMGQL